MRRSRGGAGKVAMASSSRLTKRRQRSSGTSSPDNHGEEDGGVKLQEMVAARDEMDMKDLNILERNKRRRGLQGCDARDEGQESTGTDRCDEGEFDVEHAEVTLESMAKSFTEMVNPNQRSLRSVLSPVRKMRTCVIGAPVPRKARSACAKRSPHEYPASGYHSHQQHSNSSESGEKTAGSKKKKGKAIKLYGSVEEDIELEVAEVLFSLMRQSHQSDTTRESQQRPLVSDMKKSEQIKEDDEVFSGKNIFEQGRKPEGSELEFEQKDVLPVRLENAETLIKEDGLVKEIKKEKSSQVGYVFTIESRNFVETKAIQMAPFAEYQTGKLEIDFMVSPKQYTESGSELVQDSKRTPRDVDTKTIERTNKHMPEVTVEKQEKNIIDMRCLSVPIHDTSLQLEQPHWRLEAAKTAQITSSSSFPVIKDLCPTKGHLQPRETRAFMDKSSGPFMVGQSRMVSQDGRKRCATHYYIAQSIMNRQQCNKMNCLSSATGSACSSDNGLSLVKADVIERQQQGAILKGNKLVSITPNGADSTCPHDKKTATEASCLPDSAQRKLHLNHKALRLSSSEKNMIGPLAFSANQYQMVGLNSEPSGTHFSAAPLSRNATAAGAVTTYSTFSTMDPAMSFYKSHQVTNEVPPLMTMMPTNGYPFPMSSPVGNAASFEGGAHGHAMPYLNGSLYPPQIFYPPQPLGQQPRPQAPILPSGQTTTTRSSSSRNQPHQQLQHGPNVTGHSLLPSANVNSQFPLKQHIQSSRQSRKSEAEVSNKKPLVAENWVSYGQRSSYNQHGLPPLQQMNFTMMPMPMVAGNGNASKFEKQESNQGPKIGLEHPTSQAFSMSYPSFGGSRVASGINFSFPTQNLPLWPSLPDGVHQRYLVPHTADIVNQNNYQAGAKSGIDFSDGTIKGATGKPSSCTSQSPAFCKALPYDQTGMMKGCSIFDSSSKTLSFNSATDNVSSQNHHGVQLQQHYSQGMWDKNPAINGQTSPAMSTNVSYSPVLMSHSANWNSSARLPIPQSTSTLPTFIMKSSNPVISSPCSTEFAFGGNNVKSVAAHGTGMSVLQPHATLASSCQIPSPKSSQSLRGNKSASPTNETSSSSPSPKIAPSPVCRRNVPSILSACPSQVSEVKY
ncbi:unnamed protein product [Rhodiola kirilowii]